MSLVPYADDDVTMGDDPQPGDDEGDDAGAVAAQPMQVSPQGKGVFEIQMADGPIALENKTIIVDHGSLVGFDKNAEHFTAMLVAVVDGEWTMHTTRPGHYMSLKEAKFAMLPQTATLHDGSEVLVIKVQCGIDSEDLNKVYFQVNDGKSMEAKTSYWVPKSSIKSLLGAPKNELAKRRWLSISTGVMSRDPYLRALNLTSAKMVMAYAISTDKASVYEKVFDKAEKELRAVSDKMTQEAGEQFIKEKLPDITYYREAYSNSAEAFGRPFSERFSVIHSDFERRLDAKDEAHLVANNLREIQLMFS